MNAVQTIIDSATQCLNYEGMPTFRRPLKEDVVSVLTTGTASDTFYVSAKEMATDAVRVLLNARNECPEFLARALVYARHQGLMKTLPVLGLVVLSGGRGKTRDLFESVFNQVIRTPDDLRAFVALCKSGTIPGRTGFGGMVVPAVKAWMQNMSEYHAVKYGSANSREITLRDVLRMSRPKPGSRTVEERFGYLVKGYSALGNDPTLNPQIRAFESLKVATTQDEQLAIIRDGKLPYEVVVPTLRETTPAIWEQLLHNAPYMNLLRNLVTFTRHEVFQKDENVQYAVQRLTDPTAIARSKVLPFRFFSAWQTYTRINNPDNRIADALRIALEKSFVNMPSLGKQRVAIGTDVSGSMASPISTEGSTRFIDIAGIFTGALLKACEGRVVPLPFEDRVRLDCTLSGHDSIMTTSDKIASLNGGGTAIGAPIEYLLNRKIEVDTFIGITDHEDWAYGNGWNRGCSGGAATSKK